MRLPDCPAVESKPEVLGGTPVFTGTRVPIEALFDNLEAGHNLAYFLDDFPTVQLEQALDVLKHARTLLLHASRVLSDRNGPAPRT